MSRTTKILLGLLALVCGFVLLIRVLTPDVEAIALEQNREAMFARRSALYASQVYREETFERLPPPESGDWLWSFPDGGQTFPEFKAVFGARKQDPARTTIVFQPLGPLSPRARAALEPIRKFTAAFFQRPVRIADELPIPESCYLPADEQYDADALLTWMAARRPKDALIYAGVADRDLTTRQLGWIFGLGRLGGGLGVYSLLRFREDADDALYLRRAVGLLDHEIGHALGFAHCPFYRCSMNGQNSLAELDRTPKLLGPVCLRKLQLALGFEVVPRYRAIAKACRELGLKAVAKRAEERADHLTQAGRTGFW